MDETMGLTHPKLLLHFQLCSLLSSEPYIVINWLHYD